MTKLTLNDVFNQWLNNKGLLKYLTENFNVAWKGSVDGSVLDLEYHGNRSGTKIVAPLLLKLVDENGISTHEKLNRLNSRLKNIENACYLKYNNYLCTPINICART